MATATTTGWSDQKLSASKARALFISTSGKTTWPLSGSTIRPCASWAKAMAGRFGATRIAIVPTSGQFDTHKHILADFVDEIRPMLDED